MNFTENKLITIFIGIIIMYLLESIFAVLSHIFLSSNVFFSAILGLTAVFIGSSIIGYRMKQRGWFYGGIAGLTLSLLFLALNILGLLFHPAIKEVSHSSVSHMTLQTMMKNITILPINIFIAALGGLTGEHLLSFRKVH